MAKTVSGAGVEKQRRSPRPSVSVCPHVMMSEAINEPVGCAFPREAMLLALGVSFCFHRNCQSTHSMCVMPVLVVSGAMAHMLSNRNCLLGSSVWLC